MSMLGVWGAGLEVILIFYFISTSLIGLYNLPGVRRIRPVVSDSPTSHIIYNCGLVLILSSALPLLARILGTQHNNLKKSPCANCIVVFIFKRDLKLRFIGPLWEN